MDEELVPPFLLEEGCLVLVSFLSVTTYEQFALVLVVMSITLLLVFISTFSNLKLAEDGRDEQRIQSQANGIPVVWRPPQMGSLKLNGDGSSKRGGVRAGGGGILRDHFGRCLFVFAHHYKGVSAIFAETRAMLDGLTICRNLGYSDVLSEMDSLHLVQAMVRGASDSWQCGPYWFALRSILGNFPRWYVSHTYHKGNFAADSLANLGSINYGERFYCLGGIPLPPLVEDFVRKNSLSVLHY
ncbi:hypothetical protein AMTR_s00108p00128900, partial [Amborella trichopoda]